MPATVESVPTEIDYTQLDAERRAGEEVFLRDPVPFGSSEAEDLRWLRLLREATSHAVRLRWTLGGIPRVPLAGITHLIPPVAGCDEQTNRCASAWAAGYRYGMFYYRIGPGFVAIRDVRPGFDKRRLVIEDGSEHFVAMATATSVAELSPPARQVVGDAVNAGLALLAGDDLLVLPYRIRHWPVPYVGI